MYPYIVCFCGFGIGRLYDLFCAMRLEKQALAFEESESGLDPLLLPIADDIEVDLRDVFDQLGVRNMCCRTRLATQVPFSELY